MANKDPLKRKAKCEICNVFCSSAFQLCEHVVGHKHKMNAKRVSPGTLPHVNKLQYFFDTYMKLEGLVGLEYVEEMQLQSGYQYKCGLCGFQGERKPAFLHITGADHITRYLDKHHPKLSVRSSRYPQKTEHVKALQQAAAKACERHGRRKIKEINVDDEGPTPPKVAKCSSDPKALDLNGDFHTRSLRYLEREDDECPGGLSGFKGNGDFLDYLQKFQIRSDEDAWIIKQITQNCTQALVRYRKEQAQREEPGGEGPAGSSVSGKVAPVRMSAPQTDATQLFFNSIKNMEESEVVDILHKIAATNPAFRGIDIPNVIKYLQATGRLKAS